MSNPNPNPKSKKTQKKIKMAGGGGGGDTPDNIIDYVIQTSPESGDDLGMIAGALNYGSNALDSAQNALATAKNVTATAVDIGGKVVEKTMQLKDPAIEAGKQATQQAINTVQTTYENAKSFPSKAQILSFDSVGHALGLDKNGKNLSQQTPEEIAAQLKNLNDTFKSPAFQKELNKLTVEASKQVAVFGEAAKEPLKDASNAGVEIAANAADKMIEQSAQLVLNAIGIVPVVGEVLSAVRAVDNLIKMGVLSIDAATKSATIVGDASKKISDNIEQAQQAATDAAPSMPQMPSAPSIPVPNQVGGHGCGPKKTLRAMKKESKEILKRVNKSIKEHVVGMGATKTRKTHFKNKTKRIRHN